MLFDIRQDFVFGGRGITPIIVWLLQGVVRPGTVGFVAGRNIDSLA